MGHLPALLLQEGIGLDAINDAFLLESSVYRLLRRYCGQQPFYLHLLELFLQVSLAPQTFPWGFLGVWACVLMCA